MYGVADELLKWYHANKRDLPWRDTKNPYKIWLSEIILQQTRVEQGWNYYLAFLDKYPTVGDLAKASEQEVLKMWEGLGYYSRARNLHFTAKYITSELQGEFPTQYSELLKLKGVGKYTAAAIASFAYGEAVPAIDGNVYRVLARVFGEYEMIHTPKAEKRFRELAIHILPVNNAGDFNQAMMELGAMVCKPVNPHCDRCPLILICWAYKNKAWAKLPVKKSKLKIKHRYFNYLIIEHDGKKLLQKREHRDIWQHLYQFPLLEAQQPSLDELGIFLAEKFKISETRLTLLTPTPLIHKLTHQHIHLFFWKVLDVDNLFVPKCHVLVSGDELCKYPVPVPIMPFL